MPNTNLRNKRGATVRSILLRLDQDEASKVRIWSEALSLPATTIIRKAIVDLPHPPSFAQQPPLPAITDAAMLATLRQVAGYIAHKIKTGELRDDDYGVIRDTMSDLAEELRRRIQQ